MDNASTKAREVWGVWRRRKQRPLGILTSTQPSIGILETCFGSMELIKPKVALSISFLNVSQPMHEGSCTAQLAEPGPSTSLQDKKIQEASWPGVLAFWNCLSEVPILFDPWLKSPRGSQGCLHFGPKWFGNLITNYYPPSACTWSLITQMAEIWVSFQNCSVSYQLLVLFFNVVFSLLCLRNYKTLDCIPIVRV